MKKKRMAVKRTAGKPLCEMELKVRERYSETHYGGKRPEICRHVANAMTFSTVFEHRDRSRHRHRSNRRRKKTTFDFLKKTKGAQAKKLFGPRKPRCVDFFMQTYSERYDFFDRFRSFSSTAIDRGIGIRRFGVEKTTFDFLKKYRARKQKIVRAPKTAMRRFLHANI